MNDFLKLCVLLILYPSFSLAQIANDQAVSGPYLGQQPPGLKVEIFAPSLISTERNEMNTAFTRDATELYFTRSVDNKQTIFYTREANGKWSDPAPVPFSGKHNDRDFTISPDEKQLLFASDRNLTGERRLDIWMVDIKEGKWSDPYPANLVPELTWGSNYPSMSNDGTIYFFSCLADPDRKCELYKSQKVGTEFTKPAVPDPKLNTSFHEWDPFIAPDKTYIIFGSKDRPDGYGDGDLYISFKDEHDNWLEPLNMGPDINSSANEICPVVTLDGQYFFFTSSRKGNNDLFWISTGIFESLRKSFPPK